MSLTCFPDDGLDSASMEKDKVAVFPTSKYTISHIFYSKQIPFPSALNLSHRTL